MSRLASAALAAALSLGIGSGAALAATEIVMFFPVAVEPLWQRRQSVKMPEWSNRAMDQEVVMWQSPQSSELGTWLADLLLAS